MEKVAFYQSPSLQGSIYYTEGSQALIKSLESCYANNEVLCGNRAFARQRALGNAVTWNKQFYGCPQVQGKVDSEKVILFDDQIVDVNSLENHPLLNPSFLRDHWKEIRNGSLALSPDYFANLVDLSANPQSGVRKLRHKDLSRINRVLNLVEAKDNPYFTAFTGLSVTEKEAYFKAHEVNHGKFIGVYLNLDEAKQKVPIGRLSVFDFNENLLGLNFINGTNARLFGVEASLASSSTEGAAKNVSIEDLLADLE